MKRAGYDPGGEPENYHNYLVSWGGFLAGDPHCKTVACVAPAAFGSLKAARGYADYLIGEDRAAWVSCEHQGADAFRLLHPRAPKGAKP